MNGSNRLWYTKTEAAELMGLSVATINRLIRQGKEKYPPTNAIRPHQVREFEGRTLIHISWVLGEAGIVIPPVQINVTTEQLADALKLAFGIGIAAEPVALTRKAS